MIETVMLEGATRPIASRDSIAHFIRSRMTTLNKKDNWNKLVIGFAFSKDVKRVLLIHKNRPNWQKGKVNAIGGKLKVGETVKAAMVREFSEETGVKTQQKEWILVGKMLESPRIIYVLATRYEGTNVKTVTDEQIEWFPVNKLPHNSISNLSWLVPLCKDKLDRNIITRFTARNKV